VCGKFCVVAVGAEGETHGGGEKLASTTPRRGGKLVIVRQRQRDTRPEDLYHPLYRQGCEPNLLAYAGYVGQGLHILVEQRVHEPAHQRRFRRGFDYRNAVAVSSPA